LDARGDALLALFETERFGEPDEARPLEFEPIDESANVESDAEIQSVDAAFDLLALAI
jgi:hypothetical protein